jgi:mono/diheme cytochrome c family protein
LAPRAALLIALLALGLAAGAVGPLLVQADEGCRSCHAQHFVFQGACVECHRGTAGALRQELAHARLLTGAAAEHALSGGAAVQQGKQLAERSACRRCHTIGGTGNRLATNLDRIVWKREQAELRASITTPVENMPAFHFDRAQADALIALLLRSGDPRQPQDAYRVRFTRAARARRTVFDERCGGCHRFLGALGPVGTGNMGPNLSGLFTAFYPKTASGDRPWSAQALRDWVQNPRATRSATTMPPVVLTEDDLQAVTDELAGPDQPPGGAGIRVNDPRREPPEGSDAAPGT